MKNLFTKLFVVSFMLVYGGSVWADGGVTPGSLSIEPNGEAYLDIFFNAGEVTDATGCSFLIYLPEGLTVDTENYKIGDVTTSNHIINVIYQTRNKRYKVGITSNPKTQLAKTSGLLISVLIKANNTVAKGTVDGIKVVLSDIASESDGNVTTGINKEEQIVVAASGGAPVVINANGYATACSAKALDFSAVEGVEAVFTVSKVADNTATLSPIESMKVPANAGIVVKGTSGTVFVPFAEGSVAELGTNELIGVTSATAIDEGCYILQGEEFVSCIAGTLPAGKAYLPASVGSSGAKAFTFDFGESTGINEVKTAKADGAIYSISGVRVAEPQKGVYIMNGRKVIVK